MASTPNFNWSTPDNTGLVKNGALDIRTLGNSIDASMVDLKGGTTGQILAKATDTDMDFAWITNDVGDITAVTAGTGISGGGTSGAVTITNSMATAIDAKGDLVPGTGADTFARLAVGTDYGFLQAISGETTGLLWNNAAWTTYTPTVSAVSGSYTTVSATGRYTRIGKLCAVQARVSITTNGTAAVATIITAPFTSASSSQTYNGSGRENLSTGLMLNCRIGTSDTNIYIEQYNALYAGANNRQLDISIIYEVA
jgi:hypothetical protein